MEEQKTTKPNASGGHTAPAPLPGDRLPEHLRWRGPGPEPASWFAPCGTKVYRSYSDYCDD